MDDESKRIDELRSSSRLEENPLKIRNFMDPLQPFLAYQGFVVLDGGLATELEKKGADIKDTLWSSKVLVENPDLVQQVHEEYVKAGADIITSCSYQSTFQGFEKKGMDASQAKRLFEKSVKVAKQAVENVWSTIRDSQDSGGTSVSKATHRLKPLVAASLGPYGCYEGSEFVGNYGKTVEELMDFHRPRVSAILGADPELLLFETVPCANEEVTAITRLLKEEFSNVPTIISFSCKDSERTCCGEPLVDGVRIASKVPNVVAIGVNCTSPTVISSLIEKAYQVTDKPIVVYPNSGETWDQQTYTWKDKPTNGISTFSKDWLQKGAKVIGGCCRTSPEDIKQIRANLISVSNLNPTEATEETYRKTFGEKSTTQTETFLEMSRK